MEYAENIALNAKAMREAGVPEHVVQELIKAVTEHAASLPH
jgi:hypothetical protein